MQKRGITNLTFQKIIVEEWNNLDQDIITNTINTMYQRLEKIIENKGNYINY